MMKSVEFRRKSVERPPIDEVCEHLVAVISEDPQFQSECHKYAGLYQKLLPDSDNELYWELYTARGREILAGMIGVNDA